MTESRQLRGWKAIAQYLAVSERTVKRWEQTHGLPVHRVRGASRDTVFGVPAELELWRRTTHPESDPVAAGSAPNGFSAEGGPDVPPRTEGRPRVRPGRLTWVGGFLAILLITTAGFYAVRGVQRPVPLGPTILLQLSTPDGWSARVGIRDGDSATVAIAGGRAITLRPHLTEDGVLLEVAASGALKTSGAVTSGVHLQPSATVRITAPVPVDVEWIETRGTPAR